MLTLDPATQERPVRRQITKVNIAAKLDTGETAAPIPELSAQVYFTDLWRTPAGDPIAYDVPGSVTLTHEELLAIPHALEVIAAVQALSYQKAQVELQ